MLETLKAQKQMLEYVYAELFDRLDLSEGDTEWKVSILGGVSWRIEVLEQQIADEEYIEERRLEWQAIRDARKEFLSSVVITLK